MVEVAAAYGAAAVAAFEAVCTDIDCAARAARSAVQALFPVRLAASVAMGVELLEAAPADMPAVAGQGHLAVGMVLAAFVAAGIVPVAACLADTDYVPVPVMDGKGLHEPLLTFGADMAAAASTAVQPAADFMPAADAQPRCAYCQGLIVPLMVGADAYLPVEVRICPVGISSEARVHAGAVLMPATIGIGLP